MTRVSLMILLLVSAPEAWATDEVSSEKVCSYFDVLTQLNISKGNELYTMTRPILDYRNQTIVHLEIALYGILGMDEKEQMFVASLLTSLQWHSDLFSWNPEDFCGITYIPSIPKKLMWEPDIIIEEMIAEDKAPPSPFLTLYSNGTVELNRGMVVVSTCLMQIFSFPFDTQRCTLTFKSITHTDKELRLLAQGSNAAPG
ncbi:5-hydroxytryptamine receptor 3A isoform X2 [Gadus morhua]|uniref:5-hydroxytryptamine receptor 3A isoform X2 n=1 Tax=Gadus morhua TaxID=8049 RepID=UPI0011B4E383|nr:5-hydroxytryptamine receptor 3A-like isoform X2 [Gadus morhua]